MSVVNRVTVIPHIPETAEDLGFPTGWPDVSIDIWRTKYQLSGPDGRPLDRRWQDTVSRVARTGASVEAERDRAAWTETFRDAIEDFEFLPAGRILAGAGSNRRVTLFNCFVMGRIDDDLSAIFDNLKEAAATMQQGGGIGHDFSSLRPKGAVVSSIGADASGPVSFMDVWDAMCRTIQSAGQRRGAMMATLRCDHPDIESFIDAKRAHDRLRNFNLSVLVTDAFIEAVRAGAAWDLVFDGKVYRTVEARALWRRIMRATYDAAEPGVVFIDRVNARNGLNYCETIHATNPCGEQPLPSYGACLLGSINLARLVKDPFGPSARLDMARLEHLTATAVRFLDNIIDVSGYPLAAQRAEAMAKRRIGLGVTGLADALVMLGVHYGSKDATGLAETWLKALKIAAYRASAAIARDKGPYPLFDRIPVLERVRQLGLPAEIEQTIETDGLRNGLLTSIAPTGTLSLLAGNVSSGIEPVFDVAFDRRVRMVDGSSRTVRVEDYAVAQFKRLRGSGHAMPATVAVAADLTPRQHLEMQAAAQRQIDSAISKTINCPADIAFEDFESIYLDAYALGLKGVTTYRPNAITGTVLSSGAAGGPTQSDQERLASTTIVARSAKTTDVADVVTSPLARAPILAGFTYKLAWPASAHALYITINDTDADAGGRRRPFEIFINTKTLEHHAWTVALTRMISAVFRRGGDVSFVVEELKAIVDPQGGCWLDGIYVPSLIAAIGGVIETHLARDAAGGATQKPNDRVITRDDHLVDGSTSERRGRSATCPRCGSPAYELREGCWVCRTCGHSSCG